MLISVARTWGVYLVDHPAVGISVVASLVLLWIVRKAFVPANLRRAWPLSLFWRRSDPRRAS
jgi:hypothetical protein